MTTHVRINESKNYSIKMKLKIRNSFSPFSAECLASLFSERDHTGDLTFHTSDDSAVNAHSFIIAASMNPTWRDLLASHVAANHGDQDRVVIILPDVSTAELNAVLCFIYGLVDAYCSSTEQLWTKLLHKERVPHKLKIRRRSLSEERHTFEGTKSEEPEVKSCESDDSDYRVGYYGDDSLNADDEQFCISGSELGSKVPHGENTIDEELVQSSSHSRIDEKEEVEERRGDGTWWKCILTDCQYKAPNFPSLSGHLRSMHPEEKISTLRCEICSKICKNKSFIIRHTFGEDCQR